MSRDAIDRALEIVNAVEWEGDMRQNMTLVIGAGRVLAKALQSAENLAAARGVELLRLEAELRRAKQLTDSNPSPEADDQSNFGLM